MLTPTKAVHPYPPVQGLAGHDDPDAKSLDLYSCTCLLGYSLLPLVVHSLASLLMPR